MQVRFLVLVVALLACSNSFAASLADFNGDYVLAEAQGSCAKEVTVTSGLFQNYPEVKFNFKTAAGTDFLRTFSKINGGSQYEFNDTAHVVITYLTEVTFDGVELIGKYHYSTTSIHGRTRTSDEVVSVMKDHDGALIYNSKREINGEKSHDYCRYVIVR